MKRPIEKLRAFLGLDPSPCCGEVVPTHRCRVCGAFWRYWLKQDTLQDDDSWSLVSTECSKCCDNSFMDEQILPVTISDIREFLSQNDEMRDR